MYSIDEVVHAAAIITASFPTLAPELLPHHRQELQFAFESLGGVLRSTSSPTDTSQLHDSSLEGTSNLSHHNSPKTHNIQNGQRAIEIEDTATEDRPQQNHRAHSTRDGPIQNKIPRKPRNSPSQDTYLNAIINLLDQFSTKIHSFVDNQAETAVLYLENWTHMDPFEVDIQLSLRGSSTAQKFRTFLARYIFAEKYLDWAESTYKKPRGSFLRLNAREAASKQISHISEYLEAIDRPDTRSKRSVEHGLKLHSFAHIYEHCGAFSFLFYVHTQFRELKYESLELLAQRIDESSAWSTFAVEKKEWFSKCVSLYKMDCAAYRKQRRLKRPIDPEGLEESPNKRRQEDFTSSAVRAHGTNMTQGVCQDANTSQPTVELSMNEMASLQNSGISGFSFDEVLWNPYFADFGFPEIPDPNMALHPTISAPDSHFNPPDAERDDPSLHHSLSVPQPAR